MNSITNAFATVTVSKSEYERLVRDSEQLRIVKDFFKKPHVSIADFIEIIVDDEKAVSE